MRTLGLEWSAVYDEAMIRRAWKRKVKASHPDKNPQSSAKATAATQRLNAAKDTLLQIRRDPLEYTRREAEEERAACERLKRTEQQRRAEAKAREDEERRSQARERAEAREDERRRRELLLQREFEARQREIERESEARQADAERRRQEIQRESEARQADAERQLEERKRALHENQLRNRRRRLQTSRVHRKIGDYQEGKDLVEAMARFFRAGFTEAPDNALPVRAVLDLFVESKGAGGGLSALETNLFTRHAKRMFLEAWPNAVYSMAKKQRCFHNVGVLKL